MIFMDKKNNQNQQNKEEQISEQREYFELLKRISVNKKINRDIEDQQKKFIISGSSNNDIVTQVL